MLAARARAVHAQLAHFTAMRDLATAHGERWGALATAELIRRQPGRESMKVTPYRKEWVESDNH